MSDIGTTRQPAHADWRWAAGTVVTVTALLVGQSYAFGQWKSGVDQRLETHQTRLAITDAWVQDSTRSRELTLQRITRIETQMEVALDILKRLDRERSDRRE